MNPERPELEPTPGQRDPGLNDPRFWHSYGRYPYLLAKVALWGSLVFVLYWLLRNVESVMFPVLVSLLIAYLLDPAVDWLERLFDRVGFFQRKALSRLLAIFSFLILILAAITGFVLVLYPALAEQITKVIARFPELLILIEQRFVPWVELTFGYDVPADVSEAMSKYGQTLEEQLPMLFRKASQWSATVLTQTGAVVASILNLVMIPLFTFYFLRDFDKMTLRLAALVPERRHAYYLTRIEQMDTVVGEWFRGQVTVALILAVLYSVGLGLVFGLSGIGAGTGVAIGILAGVLNIVPYFGFLIGFVLSVLMVVLDWGGIGPLIGVGIVFAVVQTLEGYVITPKIVGEKVGLSPVTVIIVLLLGGELFGLLGVLLAIPVAGVLRVLLPDLIAYYESTPFYSGDYRAHHEAVVAPGAESAVISDPSPGLVEATDGNVDAATGALPNLGEEE